VGYLVMIIKRSEVYFNEYAVLGDKSVVNAIPHPLPLTHRFLKSHKHQHQISDLLTSIPKTPQSPTSNSHNCCITIIIFIF
jgi:hypothetical protein